MAEAAGQCQDGSNNDDGGVSLALRRWQGGREMAAAAMAAEKTWIGLAALAIRQ